MRSSGSAKRQIWCKSLANSKNLPQSSSFTSQRNCITPLYFRSISNTQSANSVEINSYNGRGTGWGGPVIVWLIDVML
jgi:hypothetical protein